jgi:hypothetical protein
MDGDGGEEESKAREREGHSIIAISANSHITRSHSHSLTTHGSSVEHQSGPSSALLLESDIGSVSIFLQARDGSAEEEKVLDLVL